MAPNARALFRGDMRLQEQRLMTAIVIIASNLNRIETIAPMVRALARRHVGYGVRPEHYPAVGAALLWTLEQGLGGDFTPALRDAWAAAYATLSELMIASAYPEQRQVA